MVTSTMEQVGSEITPTEVTKTGVDHALSVVSEKFPNYRLAVEVCLSAIATLLLEDNANPAFLIKEGASGSGKTTIDEIIGRISELTLWVDSFTQASFVSQRADKSEEQLQKSDLLPRLKHRVLITPDLAPTLGQKRDNLKAIVGVITRVLDGQGYSNWSGAKGGRGYSGDHLFVWLASTTPLSREAWSEIGRAGTRAMLLHLSVDEQDNEALDFVALLAGAESYSDKKTICHSAVEGFLRELWKRLGGPRSVAWPKNDSDELLGHLGQLAKLVGVDWRAMTDDGSIAKDSPQRYSMLLYNLARGHALLYGRHELNSDDLAIVARVAADSIPNWRRPILRALIRKGELTTSDVMQACAVSRPIAVRRMEELETIGAVELLRPGGDFGLEHSPWRIKLLPAHQWVLNPENQWLWKHLPR